jgi:release factor glutamine methyltransferase
MFSSWDKLTEKYNESMIKEKKLPEFFNYYNYGKDFKNVYEPAEDTFLLVDCLRLENDELVKRKLKNTIELGCGSGFVSCCFVNQMNADEITVNHYCVDINDSALQLTEELFNNYNLKANVIKSDLFEKLDDVVFDIIIFNPVYI